MDVSKQYWFIEHVMIQLKNLYHQKHFISESRIIDKYDIQRYVERLIKVSEEFQRKTYIQIYPPYIFPNTEDRHKYLFIYELSSDGKYNIPCDHVDQEPFVVFKDSPDILQIILFKNVMRNL